MKKPLKINKFSPNDIFGLKTCLGKVVAEK
jgi:hypothetical protein